MHQRRIRTLNSAPLYRGSSVLYVMSRDQRTHDNHALLAAQQSALIAKVPLVVLFNLHISGVRAREHYEFMLQGLKHVSADLTQLNIPFVIRSGDAYQNILDIVNECDVSEVYFDFNPLRGPRLLSQKIADSLKQPVYVVDTHNIIPVWVASDKREFAAHTMRRKVHLALEQYMIQPDLMVEHPFNYTKTLHGLSFQDALQFITHVPRRGMTIDAQPGEKEAAKHLSRFIGSDLIHYAMNRNDIANDQQSGLSPYLHFGHISSLRVALEIVAMSDRRPLLYEEVKLASHGDVPSIYDGVNALLEEMVVRKELADNFCYYEQNYTSLSAGPDWAQKSLTAHQSDVREHIYSLEQWENAQTHDLSWNAAQNQLRKSGKMHGYMRMYWAKKMLEWSETPDIALANCIFLNDAYSIDGGDPNGYVGILWSIVGLHDRPWFDRAVFGTVRYMNEGGLMRKYDVASYQKKWNR